MTSAAIDNSLFFIAGMIAGVVICLAGFFVANKMGFFNKVIFPDDEQ